MTMFLTGGGTIINCRNDYKRYQSSSHAALTLSFGLRGNLRPRLIHLERQGRERREAKSGDRPTAQGRKVRWVQIVPPPHPAFP